MRREMIPPPLRFGVVEADVFRSAQPTLKNYRFLSRYSSSKRGVLCAACTYVYNCIQVYSVQSLLLAGVCAAAVLLVFVTMIYSMYEDTLLREL